ncbi:sulfotransferase [Pseudoalteromonas sp.]|uniref:tetratricopeptide repeat-containing sulfotransferase family protein n=1 Tax=Pseudoalteromonas sp. TaxID=53249 RepID=UPI00356B5D08
MEAALILFETNNYDYAENVLQKLIDTPYEPYLKNHTLAVINKTKRNFKSAIYYYQKACNCKPDSVVDLLGLSYCYAQIRDFKNAIKVCKTQLNDCSANDLLKDYLGNLYIQSNQYDNAEIIFNKMVESNGSNAKAFYSLATINKAKGQLNSAKELYTKSVQLSPNFVMAHYGLSVVTNYKHEGQEHILELEKLCNLRHLTYQDRILLSFALAKAYEQKEQYTKSFKLLKQGNDLRFKTLNYDVEADIAFIDNIKSVFKRNEIEMLQQYGDSSRKPIFIIGMPRSGTTLIEKIIGSHTSVYSAGEIDTLFSAGCSLLNPQTYLFDNLSKIKKEQIKALSDNYLTNLDQLSNQHDFVTDKLPLNFLMVGIIKILFPDAKIIHCKRNKVDTCLSIFKKNFSNDNYRFAYNLETLAKYYKSYEKLMAHWHQEFPGEIIDIDYEQLAQNPACEVPNLIQKCGLKWQDQCLEFHKTPGLVQTASAVQVREPMYTRTINLWHHYQEELVDLIKHLN